MLRGCHRLGACCSVFLLEAASGTALADPPLAPPPTTGTVAVPSVPLAPPDAAPAVPTAAAAPTPVQAPAPTPAQAPAPTPSAARSPVITLALPPAPTDAVVHVAADYPRTQLEARSRVDGRGWQPVCVAPCDRNLRVDGNELRVTAPGMSPSNAFLVDPGSGVARFRVSGGSSLHRELGIIGLAAGLPVTFGGMALFGLGSLHDQSGERTAGIVTLAVGAAAVLVALPLLLSGSTTVRNEAGRYIARARPAFSF